MRLCDRVTVLRDGANLIASGVRPAAPGAGRIDRRMTGPRACRRYLPDGREPAGGEVALWCGGCWRRPARHRVRPAWARSWASPVWPRPGQGRLLRALMGGVPRQRRGAARRQAAVASGERRGGAWKAGHRLCAARAARRGARMLSPPDHRERDAAAPWPRQARRRCFSTARRERCRGGALGRSRAAEIRRIGPACASSSAAATSRRWCSPGRWRAPEAAAARRADARRRRRRQVRHSMPSARDEAAGGIAVIARVVRPAGAARPVRPHRGAAAGRHAPDCLGTAACTGRPARRCYGDTGGAAA